MKIGVGIISWNRPDYLTDLIRSLEVSPDQDEFEFHLFQDGAICRFTGDKKAKLSDIKKSVKIFSKSKLPRKQIHWRKENVSVAINQFEAMRYLSSLYDQFIFLENDVVVAPSFLSLAKTVIEQFRDNEEIASVSPGFRLLCEKGKIKKHKDTLTFCDGHFWAEICWSDKWKKVEKECLRYYDLVKDVPYGKRSHGKINELFLETGSPMPATSQDNGKDWAIKQAGMRRLRFVVNRATGIGDHGIHSTPEKLKKSLDGHNKVYSFKDDYELSEFRVI